MPLVPGSSSVLQVIADMFARGHTYRQREEYWAVFLRRQSNQGGIKSCSPCRPVVRFRMYTQNDSAAFLYEIQIAFGGILMFWPSVPAGRSRAHCRRQAADYKLATGCLSLSNTLMAAFSSF